MAAGKNAKRIVYVAAVVCVVVLFFGLGRIGMEFIRVASYPKKYTEEVEKYAAEYDIPENLLYAVIRTESGFNAESVSSAGARGLTQITEDTFNWLLTKTGEGFTFDDLFIPEVSVKYGAFFLSILLNEYEVTQTAVAAYHAGMGNVSSWLKNPEYSADGVNLKNIPITDTNHYVNKVMDALERYERIYRTNN